MTKGVPLVLVLAAVCAAQKPEKVKLPTGRSDLAQGQKLYVGHCASCHGMNGEGGRGAVLAVPKLQRAADDTELFKVLQQGIRGTEMLAATDAMTDREVQQVAAYVKTLGRVAREKVPGDVERGAGIYHGKGVCATCHGLKKDGIVVGGLMGPELSNIGLRRNAAFLRESLTDPGVSLPFGFLMVRVVPRTGAAVSGVRLYEDTFSIQVRDAAGVQHAFRKSDLTNVEREHGKSPMPSYKQLSAAELDDLVAFLVSLREGS